MILVITILEVSMVLKIMTNMIALIVDLSMFCANCSWVLEGLFFRDSNTSKKIPFKFVTAITSILFMFINDCIQDIVYCLASFFAYIPNKKTFNWIYQVGVSLCLHWYIYEVKCTKFKSFKFFNRYVDVPIFLAAKSSFLLIRTILEGQKQ